MVAPPAMQMCLWEQLGNCREVAYIETVRGYDASLDGWEWKVYCHHSVVQHMG